MSELSRLLLKAVRSLPAEEQDTLLEAMLEPRLAPWPGPGVADPEPGGQGLAAVEVHGPLPARRVFGPQRGVGVTLPPLGPETGGPWQSVPVRLSTDQHERLKQWCQANGFTMAVVLRGLVARFLDDQATRRPRSPAEAPPPPGEDTGPAGVSGPALGQAGAPGPAPEPPDPGQAGTAGPKPGHAGASPADPGQAGASPADSGAPDSGG
jgi:hypothetical protein